MMITSLIDFWTCDNFLSFYFDTITATSTAKSTYISATTTAQMKSVLNPVTDATSLFLLRDKDNSEIMTPSLLLPFNQDNPVITMVTHAKNQLSNFNGDSCTESFALCPNGLSNYDGDPRTESLVIFCSKRFRNYDIKSFAASQS